MQRLGVFNDNEIIDPCVCLRTSKGMLSTTELIYYLANRGRKSIKGESGWWSVPDKPVREGPMRYEGRG